MFERDVRRRLEEIQSLRRQGLLTPKEAYERHLGLMGELAWPPVAVAVPVVAAPAAVGDPRIAPSTAGMPSIGWHLFAVVVALLGGAFGVIGAFLQELRAGGGIFLAFTGAPIIEEALKPAGVYLLLLRWPQAIAGRLHTALLSALGGLCFGAIESLVYVTLYFPEGGSDFVLFRFTVPLVMHASGSFLVGLGLSRRVFDWAAGRASMPKDARNFYLAAVVLHAGYNTLVTILELAGPLNFD
jgi:RsiW-degrading membrane proteinase PrsW (M82 family)